MQFFSGPYLAFSIGVSPTSFDLIDVKIATVFVKEVKFGWMFF